MSTLILPYPSTHPDLCHGKYVAGLFANGEQGAWYDPSDFSTMYQDAIGTIPVTAVGQPVGLILDKSKGAIRGPELLNANLLYSGTLNSGWSYQNLTFTAASVVPNYSYPTNSGSMQLPIPGVALNKFYEVRFSIAATSGNVGIAIGDSNVVGTFGFRGSGSYRIISRITRLLGIVVQVGSGFSGSIKIESVREVLGNHATQTTTASRPTLQIDTSGNYYLSFDGIDDSLVTGNINFTATDKMTVMAGVRKLTDTASGVFVELSADSPTTAGAFVLLSPSSSGANSYRFFSRGSIAPASSPGNGVFAAAPDTSTITCISNISGPEQTLRRNAGLVESSTASQGTGNYGNFPLYIGRRGGTSLPFNGRLYGLIVRGAATDDSHLTHAEKYLAYKSGVTL